jgi:hypothetical protein
MPVVTHFRSIIGGNFQDALGNPLALGYVTFQLSVDAVTLGGQQIAAGRIVTVDLDSSGNADGSMSLWSNDYMNPVTTVYKIKAYNAAGLQAWVSENRIPDGTPTFDLGSLTPLVY